MELKNCEHGHFYSSTESVCPRCGEEGLIPGKKGDSSVQDYNATQPLGMGGFSGVDYNGSMMPGNSGVEDYGPTEPMQFGGMGGHERENDATLPPVNGMTGYFTQPINNRQMGASGVEDYDPTQLVNVNNVRGFQPVVGWLVCVDGPSKGADYRIHAGYNYIGRDPHMDICLPNTDLTVSHNKHALIGYDPEDGIFFFGPADGKNLIKLNGKTLFAAAEIKDRDILKIGSCQYLFVALCKDDFKWEG